MAPPHGLPMSAGVASPCTGVCRMDLQSGLCEGCCRTLDEIAAWSGWDDVQRRAVVRLLPLRREALSAAGPPRRAVPRG